VLDLGEIRKRKVGDTIYFTTRQPHQIENSGATSANVLCVAVPLAF